MQDLCHIVNGDPPHWLQGIGDAPPRMYMLELVEAALESHPEVFLKVFAACIAIASSVPLTLPDRWCAEARVQPSGQGTRLPVRDQVLLARRQERRLIGMPQPLAIVQAGLS